MLSIGFYLSFNILFESENSIFEDRKKRIDITSNVVHYLQFCDDVRLGSMYSYVSADSNGS